MEDQRFTESVDTITLRLARLKSCSIIELKQQWRTLYNSEPPRRISRELLTRAVAYRIQEQVYGGLKPSTRRLLLRLAGDARAGRPLKPEPAAAAQPGTILMREWHGVTHEVRVSDRGVLYRRKRYRSLTEVAQLITGAHWNGPQFFGLRSKSRRRVMARSDGAPKRCAIYTRKSSEEGLEQNFNSLHAQRQACEAFIKSQAGEGWRLIKTAYDDGGFSGGTMDRPALKALLEHVKEKRIDVVVVYKVDRLTRSLADFAKIVEIFDAHGVSFVAVTQQFNTTTSMGRLTLNVLLSFAQFEREVTGERIRDKIAASKQKGMWMGGTPPLGYDLQDRHLVVNKAEAETVRLIFKLYLELKTLRRVREELDRRSIVSKQWVSRGNVKHGGYRFGRGALYHLLANPIYLGEIRHRSVSYPGQHEVIVERATWRRVQQMLTKKAAHPRGGTVRRSDGLLMGKLFDESGEPLYSCWAKKGKRRYRYFVSKRLVRGTAKPDDRGWRLPAEGMERAVMVGIQQILSDRGALASTLKASGFAAAELKQALETIDAKVKPYQQLETVEDAGPLIERVELKRDGMQITLNLRALLSVDKFPTGATNLRMTRLVPLQMRRRGVETRLVLPFEVRASRADPALLRALARGYQWFGELAAGTAVSTIQIATREGVSDSYVRHMVPLALLAPSIVESICTGRQGVCLSAERLKTQAGVPIEWDAQQRLLAD